MKGMPYNGGTFEDVAISEGGRRLLGDRLRQLSAKQIETLFTAAGFEDVPCVDRGVSGSREADRRAAGVPCYGEDDVLTIFPLSTISPSRFTARKYSASPAISTSMKLRSRSYPSA